MEPQLDPTRTLNQMSDNCRSISHPRDNVNQKTVQHMENCSINMVKKITREWGKITIGLISCPRRQWDIRISVDHSTNCPSCQMKRKPVDHSWLTCDQRSLAKGIVKIELKQKVTFSMGLWSGGPDSPLLRVQLGLPNRIYVLNVIREVKEVSRSGFLHLPLSLSCQVQLPYECTQLSLRLSLSNLNVYTFKWFSHHLHI